ncbi:MAG: lamin tail domain-containing protein, partial [Myxococcota bacterium]|nr:lamin tail domain-containing protein [Myxococcota bacterium]
MIWILIANAQAASLSDLVTGDLIISELHTSPAATSTIRGQWFEVHNASGDSVDLDGLVVSDGGSQGFTVSGTLTVADGDYAVFATRAAPALNGGLPVVDYVYSTTDYSLPTGNEELTLSFGVGVTFDTVSFSGADFPDEFGASLSLAPSSLNATDNDTGSNWCPAAETFGDGDYGSPGTANDDCPLDASSLLSGDLVITEVMHSPAAVAFNRGEWIEVYNASGLYIDIDGVVIDSSIESVAISNETLLRPGDYAIIAARSNPSVNGGLSDVDYRYIYGSELRLRTTDTLALSFGITTIDDVSWNPTDYDGGSGVAEQLNSGFTSATDNDDSTRWCAATSVYGDGDYGTPGAENSDCDSDTDGDGFDEDVDCDDNDASINPG